MFPLRQLSERNSLVWSDLPANIVADSTAIGNHVLLISFRYKEQPIFLF